MERLRKNHYHPWMALNEGEDDSGLLERWRRAPRITLYSQRRTARNTISTSTTTANTSDITSSGNGMGHSSAGL